MSKKKKVFPVHCVETAYPQWPQSGPLSPSRRSFLKRVGLGAGAAGMLSAMGLPRFAHGQSQEVDFSLLTAHPSRMEAAPSAPAQTAPAAAPPAPAAMQMAAPAEPAPPADGAAVEVVVAEVTENRALWIDPGYLILFQWVRPEDNDDVVGALEGSTEVVSTYLSERVDTSAALHDLGRLHEIEEGLASLIDSRVSPARIHTLHLDHDCSTVCSLLPDRIPDHDIPLPGIALPPDWE